MLRTLIVAAIVGFVAYHYGVDAGRQEVRLHHHAAVADSSRAPVLVGSGAPVGLAPRHHALANDANSARLAADSHRLVVTMQQKVHVLTTRAMNVIPDAMVAKTTSVLDDATRTLDRSLQGHHNDAWQPQDRAPGR